MAEAIFFVGGFVLGLVGDWVRHLLTSKRESKAREEERRDRRREFERESIVGFQDAFVRLLNVIVTVHARRNSEFSRTGQWTRGREPEEETTAMKALGEAYVFANRIADARLANDCLDLLLEANQMSQGQTRDAAHDASARLSELIPTVMESLGKRLNEL